MSLQIHARTVFPLLVVTDKNALLYLCLQLFHLKVEHIYVANWSYVLFAEEKLSLKEYIHVVDPE